MSFTQETSLKKRTIAVLTMVAGLVAAGCSEPNASVVAPMLASSAGGGSIPVAGSAALQPQTTLAVGQSAQMVLSSPFVSWRRNVYRTRNAGVATVSSSGLITGISNGRTYVTVTRDARSDSSLVVVGTGTSQTMTVSPTSATIQIGNTQQLTRTGGDNITYSSSDVTIAGVSSLGLVTAVGAGIASITVRSATGAVVIVPITVPMAFSIASLSVVVGSTAQITLGSLGSACAAGARSYAVASPTIATVSSAGVVTGVAAGSTTVTVNAGTCTGSLPITVTPVVQGPMVPTGAVAVNLVRFSGAAGPVTYSTGFPLPPGAIFPTNLGNVSVFLGGTEQSVFVSALGGTHPDGSLRSILIQGNVSAPAAGGVLQGYITFNAARTTPARAQVAAPTVLEAALLPTSATYLISTNVAGPMIEQSALPILPSTIRAHDADFETMMTNQFAKYPTLFSYGIGYYESGLNAYQHFVATANPKWYSMAWKLGESFRNQVEIQYLPEWLITTEGAAVHYHFTGDERVRNAVGKMNEWLTGTTEHIYRWDVPDGGYRLKGRAMISGVDCIKINCPAGLDKYLVPAVPLDMKKILPTQITKVIATQAASGLFPGTQYGGGQKNYMVGILLVGMIRYYDEVKPDPAVLASVKKSLDFMWSTQWQPSGNGFWYCSVDMAGDCGSQKVELGLNNMILPAFAWYYSKTKDANYLNMADQIFAGNRLRRPDWPGFPQQFDQAMYRVQNYYAWRQ